jgi:hypothetical protein
MKQFASGALRLLAAVVVLMTAAPLSASAGITTSAEQGRASAPGQQKKFRATRPIVPAGEAGQWRLPTVEEVAQLVDHLATVTSRPESLPETAAVGNAVAVELDGGFNGVILARPGDDGALETRCVFTFDEGLEFLGLVEIVQ